MSSFPNSLSSREWKVCLEACTTVALYTQTGKKGTHRVCKVFHLHYFVGHPSFGTAEKQAALCSLSMVCFVPTAPWVTSYHTQLKCTISRKSFQLPMRAEVVPSLRMDSAWLSFFFFNQDCTPSSCPTQNLTLPSLKAKANLTLFQLPSWISSYIHWVPSKHHLIKWRGKSD